MPTANASRMFANGNTADRKPSTNKNGLIKRPLHLNPAAQACQDRRQTGGRRSFKEIMASVRQANMAKIEERAYFASHLSNIAQGPCQNICYEVKNKAISTLLANKAASIDSLVLLPWGPAIGITSIGGIRLQTRPALLSADAQRILQQQVMRAMRAFGKVQLEGYHG